MGTSEQLLLPKEQYPQAKGKAPKVFRRGAYSIKYIAVVAIAVSIVAVIFTNRWAFPTGEFAVSWKAFRSCMIAAPLLDSQVRSDVMGMGGDLVGVEARGCDEQARVPLRERETKMNEEWSLRVKEMNRTIEDLRRREVELNATLIKRVKEMEGDMQRREREINGTFGAIVKGMREKEVEMNQMWFREKQELNRTLEGLKQREVDLNGTFFRTINGLYSWIRKLEEDKRRGEQRRTADRSTTTSELAAVLRTLQQEPRDNVTGCHSFGKEAMHSMWFPWKVGLGYRKFDKKSTLECFRSLPRKHVVFIGDSIMRFMFSELMLKLGELTEENLINDGKHLQKFHFETEDGVKTRFTFNADAKSIVKTIQMFPESLKADVLVLGTGAWEMKYYLQSNTLFMMSYISGLSASVKYLQDNFEGRVIFVMTPPLAHELVGYTTEQMPYQGVRWNTKIQALNRFATKLIIGAGYEVLDLYDFLSTGEGGFIRYSNLTKDYFHPGRDFNKMAIDIYTNEICRNVVFAYDTPAKIANLTGGFNGSNCRF